VYVRFTGSSKIENGKGKDCVIWLSGVGTTRGAESNPAGLLSPIDLLVEILCIRFSA
jgi:hypothetical protein